ncbi:response regulator [Thermodesulfobacteriota bacterium]
MTETQYTILVVDDDPAGLEFLFEYLNRASFKVLVAVNAEAVRQSIRLERPDIILLDVKMPGIDGFDLAGQLKKSAETEDIPIIFLTVLDDLASKIKAFERGAVDYITKPLQVEEVEARIHTHLTIRDLQKSLREKNGSSLK